MAACVGAQGRHSVLIVVASGTGTFAHSNVLYEIVMNGRNVWHCVKGLMADC